MQHAHAHIPCRAKRTVETRWRLTCELALPWRPFIDVEGGTVHRYAPYAISYPHGHGPINQSIHRPINPSHPRSFDRSTTHSRTRMHTHDRYDPARQGRVVEHVESWGVSALDVRAVFFFKIWMDLSVCALETGVSRSFRSVDFIQCTEPTLITHRRSSSSSVRGRPRSPTSTPTPTPTSPTPPWGGRPRPP